MNNNIIHGFEYILPLSHPYENKYPKCLRNDMVRSVVFALYVFSKYSHGLLSFQTFTTYLT